MANVEWRITNEKPLCRSKNLPVAIIQVNIKDFAMRVNRQRYRMRLVASRYLSLLRFLFVIRHSVFIL